MQTSSAARPASSQRYALGESPVWDPVREQVLWVDIESGTVHVGRLTSDGRISHVQVIHCGGPVSAVSVAANGDWALTVGSSLQCRRPNGSVARIGTIFEASVERETRRSNDAKPDPDGRLVVGTLDPSSNMAGEVLVRFEPEGAVTTIDSDLQLSNGIAWSRDGSVMYSVDSLRGAVFRRRYSTDAVGEREVLIRIADGLPDGICVDEEDHLWVAIWGAGEVRRYDSEGRLVTALAVPAPLTTSVAFVGRALDTLLITTATTGMTAEQRAEFPDAGRLFTCRPGVQGVPQAMWSGFPATGPGG